MEMNALSAGILFFALCTGMAAAQSVTAESEAAARAKTLKAGIDKFELRLFCGRLSQAHRRALGESQTLHQVWLSTYRKEWPKAAGLLGARIEKDLALTLVDHLQKEGFLALAAKLDRRAKTKRAPGEGYILQASPLEEEHLYLEASLGFDRELLKRLDALRGVLAANEAVDASGWRKLGNGAWMCPICQNRMFIQNIGRCSECGGMTSSGSFSLCNACSAARKRCRACGRPQTGPATAAMDALLKPLAGLR